VLHSNIDTSEDY